MNHKREQIEDIMEYKICPECGSNIYYYVTTEETKIFNPISRKLIRIDRGGSTIHWGYGCSKDSCTWNIMYTD